MWVNLIEELRFLEPASADTIVEVELGYELQRPPWNYKFSSNLPQYIYLGGARFFFATSAEFRGAPLSEVAFLCLRRTDGSDYFWALTTNVPASSDKKAPCCTSASLTGMLTLVPELGALFKSTRPPS